MILKRSWFIYFFKPIISLFGKEESEFSLAVIIWQDAVLLANKNGEWYSLQNTESLLDIFKEINFDHQPVQWLQSFLQLFL